MMFLQTNWIIAIALAIVFFGAGKNARLAGGENQSFLWAVLSIGVSALLIQMFDAGPAFILMAQFCLVVAIGIFRSLRHR